LGRTRHDDGGFSGGNIERPALQHLLADIGTGRVDIAVVYKVDRLTSSLAELAGWSRSSTHGSVKFVKCAPWSRRLGFIRQIIFKILRHLIFKMTGSARHGRPFFGSRK
jgi:hypothetical protein